MSSADSNLISAATIFINDNAVAFDAYHIDGSNFVKLRDLAFALNGTSKNFNVSWDGEANAVNLISNTPYIAAGGELEPGSGQPQQAIPAASAIFKDGQALHAANYNINGNNYFLLRDMGQAFDFAVEWDGAANAIRISTNAPYNTTVNTASATPAETVTPVQSESLPVSLSDAEQFYFNEINQMRSDAGLTPLLLDDELYASAHRGNDEAYMTDIDTFYSNILRLNMNPTTVPYSVRPASLLYAVYPNAWTTKHGQQVVHFKAEVEEMVNNPNMTTIGIAVFKTPFPDSAGDHNLVIRVAGDRTGR
jgi:hypothetical protein